MANRYSQIFTLTDIFNNKRLKNVLPFINYKEKVLPNGKVSRTTHGKTVGRLVYDTAASGARPFYKPLVSHKQGDDIFIGGTLVGEYDDAFNAVYDRLVGIKELISFTANNADMIRSALKEAEKNKRRTGKISTLYLKAQSIEQIANMKKSQLEEFMNNVMENIMFSDDFKETQKKYGVADWDYTLGRTYKKWGSQVWSKNYRNRTYDQAKEEWEREVGII